MILKNENKILKNIEGEILSNENLTKHKILHIDTDLQITNRILKDNSNKVKQITDKANNLPIIVNDTNYSIYNYEGYYECLTSYYKLNDLEVSTNHTLQFHVNLNDHLNEITSGIIYQKGNLIIQQKANTNNIEILINSVVKIDYTYTHSTELYLIIFLDGTNIFLINNGVIVGKSQYNGLTAIGESKLFGDGTNYFKGNLFSFKRWDNDFFLITGKSVTDKISYKKGDFDYLKRYKEDGNKKLFISSKYLRNADINSNNEITIINSEIENNNNPYVEKYSIAPVLENGLKFQNGNLDVLNVKSFRETLGYNNVGIEIDNWQNFIFSYWHKPISNTVNLWNSHFDIRSISNNISRLNGGFLYNWNSYPNKYTWYDGSFYPSTREYDIYTFHHICLILKNDVLYLLINGILENLKQVNYIYDFCFLLMDIGGFASNGGGECVIDDILFSTDNIIDPSTAQIGDKVFEPPRRKCLESKIKIY